VYIVWGWPWQILGAIGAEARAAEPGEILFFLSGKQPTILPISLRPNFTKFEHNTSIGVVMNSVGTECSENFPIRGRFSKKAQKMGTFAGAQVLRLQAAITPQ